MKSFLRFFVGLLVVGAMPLNTMEEKPLVVKGDLILLPEHLEVMSQEEQEIFSLEEDAAYEDKLGVAIQITSAEREAKKGKKYLLDTYASSILGQLKNKLSEEEQYSRILNVLGNWYTGVHPIIENRFTYRLPFRLITKKKLQKLAKGKSPRHLEILSSDKQVLLKLFFAKDRYAWSGETSCAQIAKKLLEEYRRLVKNQCEQVSEEPQDVDMVDQQMELDEQLAMALGQEIDTDDEGHEYNEEGDDYEEIPNEFPVIQPTIPQRGPAIYIVWRKAD